MDNLLVTCVEACQAAYDPTVPGIEVCDLRFTVTQLPDRTLVAFRGTADLQNWLLDMKAIPEITPTHHLGHGGFVTAYRDLLSEVLSHIDRGKPVTVTGHSLGGAIAVLFAELLGCDVVTFGCPRVYFDNEEPPVLHHMRIVQKDDPVPCVPYFFYRHDCDPVVLFDSDTVLEVKDHYITGYVALVAKGIPAAIQEEATPCQA
jgi:predicted lipase